MICPYPEGRAPSQRLKYEQYFDSWREAGYDVEVRPFWDEAAWAVLYERGAWLRKGAGLVRGILRRLRDFSSALDADLVYLHLEAIPLGPPLFEEGLFRRGIPMIYDVDDLVHLPHSSRANAFMRFLRGSGKVPELIRMARHTIVCTEYLADFARAHGDAVTNISSTIDTDLYRPRPHRERTRGVVVGWSGSHSTSPYLHLLDDVLRQLQREEGISVKVIGDKNFWVPGLSLEAQDWRRETEVEDLSEIDIGVYPLPRDEWVKGKSGLKALQYMALEIPTVAEAVGTNFEIIEDDVNGFVAGSKDRWVEVLRRLVREPALRRRIGKSARRTVETRYSVKANIPTYLMILQSVSGS